MSAPKPELLKSGPVRVQDLDLIETLWNDFRSTTHSRHPRNVWLKCSSFVRANGPKFPLYVVQVHSFQKELV